MNERIRELAEQAENYAAEQNDRFGVSYKKEYNKKFAELILTDVIDILVTYRVRVIFEDGIEHNCVHPINAIRKHFGV